MRAGPTNTKASSGNGISYQQRLRLFLLGGPATTEEMMIVLGRKISEKQFHSALMQLCQQGHVIRTGRCVQAMIKRAKFGRTSRKLYQLTPLGVKMARHPGYWNRGRGRSKVVGSGIGSMDKN